MKGWVLLPCGHRVRTAAGAPPPVCTECREDFTPDHVRARQGRR